LTILRVMHADLLDTVDVDAVEILGTGGPVLRDRSATERRLVHADLQRVAAANAALADEVRV
jgi:hypothetical protein